MLALKSTLIIFDKDEDEQEVDEDLSLLVKNVRRMYNKVSSKTEKGGKGRRKKRSFPTIVESSITLLLIARRQRAKSLPPGSPIRIPLKATWDSESESEEEVDMANVCFMTNDNTLKVTPEIILDDCELSMDELEEAFEGLSNNYDFLKKKTFENEERK